MAALSADEQSAFELFLPDRDSSYNNSIQFVFEEDTWLTIYANDANPGSLSNSQWLIENVVIESAYRPIVRRHKDGWIIIFEEDKK